jgi:hypothetical protein
MNNIHVIIRRARAYKVHTYCQYSHLNRQGIISNNSRATPIKSHDTPSNLLRVMPISVEGSPFHLGEDSLLFSITLGALPSYVHHILSRHSLYVNIYNTLVPMSLPHEIPFRWTRRKPILDKTSCWH